MDKIDYSRQLNIVGVGLDAWARLGIEQWFDNVAIIANRSNDMTQVLPELTIKPLSLKSAKNIKTTQQLIDNSEFVDIAGSFKKYRFFAERPVDVENLKNNGIDLFVNSVRFRKTYENKNQLRQMLDERLFAPHEIIISNLLSDSRDEYSRLIQRFGVKLVLQDDSRYGGSGTFIVKKYDEYQQAITLLKSFAEEDSSATTIISKFIEGEDLSIQCCMTNHGLVLSPIMRQLIGYESLVNKRYGSEQFAGIEVGVKLIDATQSRIEQIAKEVGRRLKAEGYKGVFGVDFRYDGASIYLVEVNARLTGASSLLTMLQVANNEVPLVLLHLLEILDQPYEYTGALQALKGVTGSVLVLHNVTEYEVEANQQVHSGTYAIKEGRLEWISNRSSLDKTTAKGHFVLQSNYHWKHSFEPGARLARIYINQRATTHTGKLAAEISEIIATTISSITA